MNKLPILIVLYNPDLETITRLSSIQKDYTLFLFDNSQINNSKFFSDSIYYKNKSNNGITGAFKWMYNQCLNLKYESFIFFDQDTFFSVKSIQYINDNYFNNNNKLKLVHYTSENKKMGSVKFVINSGTVFRINILSKCFTVLDRYFVDAVDLALCYYARKNDFNILVCAAPDIDHIINQGYQTKLFMGKLFSYKYYPKIRRYEFYLSHFRLIKDMIVNIEFKEVYMILYFISFYYFDQIRSRILKLL